MLRLSQVKLSAFTPEKSIEKMLITKICNLLHIKNSDISSVKIVKKSLDARKKPELFFSFTVDFNVKNEDKVLAQAKKNKSIANNINKVTDKEYEFPYKAVTAPQSPIVIVGTGPAGLFCGLYLARVGLKPILLERGMDVDARTADVEKFWQEGRLNPESNIQFGEGGAGTFSDGKLGTLVKDVTGRNGAVLREFVRHGAPEKILYDYKPHIGTDILRKVVKSIRQEIISLGGEVRFNTKVTDICKATDSNLLKITTEVGDVISAYGVVLAIGHSARDTFKVLYDRGFKMEQKPFAVGFRVQHLQSMIDFSQYGLTDVGDLGAAPYKVTAKTSTGRGVFSFCMCPGGYVVNASSEEGHTAVNGMSYSGRNGKNANSAIIVSVNPSDYPSDHPLSGIEFQRQIEKRAYDLGKGDVPIQRYGGFIQNISEKDDIQNELMPEIKGRYRWVNLRGLFTDEIEKSFIEGMDHFDKIIPGFSSDNTILAGVESRTSSPVRIVRDEKLVSNIGNVFPCGEGAGYAGGITSAAMDGIKVAEAICDSLKSTDD